MIAVIGAVVVLVGIVWAASGAGSRTTGAAAPAGRDTVTVGQSTKPATPLPVGGTSVKPTVVAVTAPCVAADGVDAAGNQQSYVPDKAVDGRPETAWRCPGDGAGATITVRFGAPVSLTSVGLIAGFDKVDPTDGTDRFTQSPKILRVRWSFDDGSSVEAVPNGQRSMYTTAVSVRTSSATLTILKTEPGSVATNSAGEAFAPLDTTAVSELSFSGVR